LNDPPPPSLGPLLCALRRLDPFRELSRGPWLAFVAIACHWTGERESGPSQTTVARFSGYSPRAVRDAVRELERLGLVEVLRPRGSTRGSERTDYVPGPAVLALLPDIAGQPPSLTAIAATRSLPERMAGGPTALVATVAASRALPSLAATTADDHRHGLPLLLKKNKKDSSSSMRATGESPTRAGEPEDPVAQAADVTDVDRDVARIALTDCFRLLHPAAVPRTCDDADVDRVAMCAASIDGDAQVKLQALRDSLAGARRASRRTNGSPPTVRYIWGRIEHFLNHAERGRRLRTVADRQICIPVDTGPSTPQAGPSREQMDADMTRLFGPTWRASR